MSTRISRCNYLMQGATATTTASQYLALGNLSHTATFGFVLPANGSIVGLSLCTTCSVKTTNGNITGQVRVADNNVYSLTQTYTGTGTKKSSQTQVAGIDTFVAGQILSGYINFDTFVGTLSRVWLVVEVEFNI